MIACNETPVGECVLNPKYSSNPEYQIVITNTPESVQLSLHRDIRLYAEHCLDFYLTPHEARSLANTLTVCADQAEKGC